MSDRVELCIGNRAFVGFKDYSIDSDMFAAADAWSITLGDVDTAIALGAECTLRVNGEGELHGLVEKISDKGGKDSHNVVISGRDIMCVAVDSYIESFSTLRSKTLAQVAEMLLSPLPFLGRKDIVWEDGASDLDRTTRKVYLEPGQRVFDVLSELAVSRGLLFYLRHDGAIVFAKPLARAESVFALYNTDNDYANVAEWEIVRNLEPRYKTVTVLGRRQSYNGLAVTQLQTKGTVTDASFPYAKPFVAVSNSDAQKPSYQANLIMERQRADGLNIRYTVARHAQDGKNWRTGYMAIVVDRRQDLREQMLIYRRTFRMSKDQGAQTDVYVGKPGLVR